MEFTPLNDQQLRELNLYPEGRYKFLRCYEQLKKTSRAGNDYFNLKMRIWIDGRERVLFDTLLFEGKRCYISTKRLSWHKATEMLDIYDSGNIMPTDCDGRRGYLDLVHRANTETGEIQNSVKDYHVPEETLVSPADLAEMAKQHANPQNTNGFNDEISF